MGGHVGQQRVARGEVGRDVGRERVEDRLDRDEGRPVEHRAVVEHCRGLARCDDVTGSQRTGPRDQGAQVRGERRHVEHRDVSPTVAIADEQARIWSRCRGR